MLTCLFYYVHLVSDMYPWGKNQLLECPRLPWLEAYNLLNNFGSSYRLCVHIFLINIEDYFLMFYMPLLCFLTEVSSNERGYLPLLCFGCFCLGINQSIASEGEGSIMSCLSWFKVNFLTDKAMKCIGFLDCCGLILYSSYQSMYQRFIFIHHPSSCFVCVWSLKPLACCKKIEWAS